MSPSASDVLKCTQWVGYLRDSDGALLSKFLFGFFAGVGVGQVRVEIFIQDLRGLFAEITPFAPDIRKQTTIRGKKTPLKPFLIPKTDLNRHFY